MSKHQPVKRRYFSAEIHRNKLRLRVALLVFLLLALVSGQVAGKAFLRFADPDEYYAVRYGVGLDGVSGPSHKLFGYVNQVTLAVMLLAWVQYRRMQRRGDSILLSLVDATPLNEQRLVNTGQEMAIAAGIASPRMWVVESPELNAFACALANGKATIALTRGLLNQLSREEIQAVVAHETAHIRNGDARLMTQLVGMGRAFHLISILALGPLRLMFDAARQGMELPETEEDSTASTTPSDRDFWDQPTTAKGVVLAILSTPVVALMLIVVGVVLSLILFISFSVLIVLFPWLVAGFASLEWLRGHWSALDHWIKRRFNTQRLGWGLLLLVMVPGGLIVGPAILVLGILVPLMLALMRLGVSRNREFQADAVAVDLTRNPGALRSALEKIYATPVAPGVSGLPRVLGPLTIVSSNRRRVDESDFGWLTEWFSTHPPLRQRIRRLAEMEGQPVK